MRIAFLFPGQASQYVGMGKDLADRFAEIRDLYRLADEIMGASLSRICFEGPEDELRQTMYTQPAIFLHSIAVARLLGVRPTSAAGHSLGEYSALVSAGALSFEDGLRLVKKRGELMQESGSRSPGTMAAVIGAEASLVEEACREASATGVVQAANFNSPGQIVISGSLTGVERALEILKSRGVRIVKKLPVSGAFHSPLMQYAQDEMASVLDSTPIRDASFPVYTNVTAEPVQDAATIRTMLFRQITSPVLWEQSMRNMIREGMERFIEVGPGNVLQGLLKRIDPNAPCETAGTAEEIERVRATLSLDTEDRR
ncbi:MAG: ACP S-malonyltransferase [Bacteroidota bacterium]|nr:ACP S-malonyltransferase [Bacteroidota bacterium]